MEGYARNGDEYCPQLLDLISKESRDQWVVKSHGFNSSSDEKKLELSLGLGLGPPGGDHWTMNDSNDSRNHCKGDDDDSSSLFSFGYFSNHKFSSSSAAASPWPSSAAAAYQQSTQKSLHVKKAKESSSQSCSNKVVVDMQQSAAAEKKAFSSVTVTATAGAAAGNNNTAVSNSAQKRTAPAPVVGWPPIRSFRKNLTSSSSSLKSASESPNALVPNKGGSKKPIENGSQKGMFVKINMDCIPIGRKVDLKAYDSYEKLSSAVDELFRGLLAAQIDSSADGNHNKDEGEKAITGLLDGSGEYTLVYEDNEGDRMLVGDVPWHMFVATVKRLRVLKSSELPILRRDQSKHGKLSHNS